MDATCKTCPFWWYRAKDGRLMETACRRNPPRAIPMQTGNPGQPVDPYWTVWPAAQPDEWCGEHPLRQLDRLAAMAMQGILGDPNVVLSTDETRAHAARLAYQVADAMLAAASHPSPESKDPAHEGEKERT